MIELIILLLSFNVTIEEFFDKVHYETDYQSEVKGQIYPYGLMVHPDAAIVGSIIIFGLIGWILYEGSKIKWLR